MVMLLMVVVLPVVPPVVLPVALEVVPVVADPIASVRDQGIRIDGRASDLSTVLGALEGMTDAGLGGVWFEILDTWGVREVYLLL